MMEAEGGHLSVNGVLDPSNHRSQKISYEVL